MTLCKRWLAAVLVVTLAWGFSAAVRADEAAHPAEAAPAESGPGAADHGQAGHAEAGHGDAAHGGGHGAHHPTATDQVMKMLSIKADTAIWTAAVFLLLLVILGKFAWGPIAEGLEKREHSIAEHIASAERHNREAQELLASYERRLSGVQDEVRAILDEARRDAEHTQQDIVSKAQADAQAFRDRALREIETATAGALKELSERSANLAVELAGKIIRQRLTPGDHAQLIAEAVSKFPTSSQN